MLKKTLLMVISSTLIFTSSEVFADPAPGDCQAIGSTLEIVKNKPFKFTVPSQSPSSDCIGSAAASKKCFDSFTTVPDPQHSLYGWVVYSFAYGTPDASGTSSVEALNVMNNDVTLATTSSAKYDGTQCIVSTIDASGQTVKYNYAFGDWPSVTRVPH